MKPILSVYCLTLLFIDIHSAYSTGFSSDALIFSKESANTSSNVTVKAVNRGLPGKTLHLNSPSKFKIDDVKENKFKILTVTVTRQKRNDRRQQLQAERLRKKQQRDQKREENKRLREEKIQQRKMERLQKKVEVQRKIEGRKLEREQRIQRRKMEMAQKKLENHRKKEERIRDREAKKQRRIAEREQKKNERLWQKRQRQNQRRVPSYQGSLPSNYHRQPVMTRVLDSWQGNSGTERKGTNRKNPYKTKIPENDFEGNHDTPVGYNPEEGGNNHGKDNEPPISGHRRKGHVKVGVKWGQKGGDEDHNEISNGSGGGRRKGKGSVDVDVGWGGNGDSEGGFEESGGGGGQRRKGKGHVKVGVEWGKMFGNHNGGGSEGIGPSGGHKPRGNGLFNLDIGWG